MAKTAAVPSSADIFPTLFCTTALHYGQAPSSGQGSKIYDVKFCPFPTGDDEQIFAVCTTDHIFVCRLKPGPNPPYHEVLRWWKDTNTQSEYNSIVWTRDSTTHKPLLCLAGASPKHIQILDIESAKCVRSLHGHGKGINALAVSPLSTNLLFSAAEDYTIRAWNLAPEYARQPCVAIFAGVGHRQPILAMNIHANGRWMLTGGLDTAVCMWAIPSVEELSPRIDSSKEGYPPIKTIYYPVFYSTELHPNYVDNVVFHGDLIISRACADPTGPDHPHNEILLWKIDGFDSSDPAPEHPPLVKDEYFTRSAFSHAKGTRGFRRLLTFDMPWTDRFYLRFCLFNNPGCRPLLVMGNQQSKIYFWDLQTLEEGLGPGEDDAGRKKSRKHKGVLTISGINASGLSGLVNPRREQSILSGSGEGLAAEVTTNEPSTTNSGPSGRQWRLGDSFLPLTPHRKITAETSLLRTHFGTTAIAFSPDGLWMISVGDHGMMAFFRREKT